MVKAVARTGQTIFETSATTCAGLAAGFFVAFPGLKNFFVLMIILISLALLTSVILLPAMMVAYQSVRAWIRGEPRWQDYDVAGSLASDVMDVELSP
jgi:predicted RND superfamily exporter protein